MTDHRLAVIPHGYRDDESSRHPESMQDGPSLQAHLDEEQPQPADEEDGRPQPPVHTLRKTTRRAAIALALLLVAGCVFLAFCSPFVFLRYLTFGMSRLFEGPYWSRDGPALNWLSRSFLRDDFSTHCKIKKADRYDNFNASAWWTGGDANPDDWSDDERALRTVPQYVLDYAPLIHLSADEEYWPGDPAEHLVHTTPFFDGKPVAPCDSPYNLTNLDELNDRFGPAAKNVFLRSNDNSEDRPDWVHSPKNIPRRPDGSIPELLSDDDGDRHDRHPRRRKNQKPLEATHASPGGRSNAPVVLLVVPKDDGVVDAFWFFFYSYNRGNSVLNIRFGDHIGDWEHTLVRFVHGRPESLFFSEHFFGEAVAFAAAEKTPAGRPIGYSGVGTHAMYSTPGVHNYILPLGLLHDATDRGPLWDIRQNMQAYTYDHRADRLRAATRNPAAPTGWFYFLGHWGDARYSLGDSRQYRLATEYHYVDGPLGPRYKNLRRSHVCQQNDVPCRVRDELPGAGVAGLAEPPPVLSPADVDETELMSAEDERQFIRHEPV